MESINVDDYKNLLEVVDFTSEDIIEQIKDYDLTFNRYKNPTVEWRMKLPLFIKPFYTFIVKYKRIPTQKEMYDGYLSMNKEFFEKGNFDRDITDGIQARVYRTYPSLVRDIYFNLYVYENLKDAKVLFNPKLDFGKGIDLLVVYNGVNYGINLYTDTKSAHKARDIKAGRHEKYDNIYNIELPVSFKTNKLVGKFYLYGESEFNKIKDILGIEKEVI